MNFASSDTIFYSCEYCRPWDLYCTSKIHCERAGQDRQGMTRIQISCVEQDGWYEGVAKIVKVTANESAQT